MFADFALSHRLVALSEHLWRTLISISNIAYTLISSFRLSLLERRTLSWAVDCSFLGRLAYCPFVKTDFRCILLLPLGSCLRTEVNTNELF